MEPTLSINLLSYMRNFVWTKIKLIQTFTTHASKVRSPLLLNTSHLNFPSCSSSAYKNESFGSVYSGGFKQKDVSGNYRLVLARREGDPFVRKCVHRNSFGLLPFIFMFYIFLIHPVNNKCICYFSRDMPEVTHKVKNKAYN